MLSVCIRVHPWPKTNLRKLTERQRKQAIWPRMDTDTHGCGVSASSRSTGRRLEQNCMVMFWRNAILVDQKASQEGTAQTAPKLVHSPVDGTDTTDGSVRGSSLIHKSAGWT